MDITVWPMRGALPRLEHAGLELAIFLVCKLGRRHADVLHVADALALREARIAESSRVPENLAYVLV